MTRDMFLPEMEQTYILSQANIIKPTETINATTLPKIEMPNHNGFEPDPRPELDLYK